MKVKVQGDSLMTRWKKESYFSLSRHEIVCYTPRQGFVLVVKESGSSMPDLRFPIGLWRVDTVVRKT